MEKNTILNITIFLCGLSRVFYALFGMVLLFFFIHLQVSPSFYDDFYWVETEQKNEIPTIIHSKIKSADEINWKEDTEAYPVSSITTFSLYYTFFQLMGILTFFYLATFEFQRVVESVKDLKTFQERNVKAFRRIGNYFLGIAAFSFYSHIAFGNNFVTEIEERFVTLFTILIAFILAEIFKEGNKLQEENQLTV